MTQERADEIVRKVIYARFNVMPKMKDSDDAFHIGRMIGQMQRQLEIELSLEVEKSNTGHWIKTPKAVMGEGYLWYCDKCEHQVYQDSSKNYPSEKYCSNCGAKMVKPEESEE